MNTHNQGKKPKPTISAPKKPAIPREAYLQHPEFATRIGKEMEGVTFPADKIPVNFKKHLYAALKNVPFTALNMPLPFYYDLICSEPADMTFGLLQKAADVVYNSKPCDNLADYYLMILSAATLKDAMSEITDPIRDKVIDSLVALEAINQSGLIV